MLQFSPPITMRYSISDDVIVVRGEANETVIADADVVGISADVQQVAYGEFRRNIVIEHIDPKGCAQTTFVHEMVDRELVDGQQPSVHGLTTYVNRVAPWAARNVAKRLAEFGTVSGRGYEIRGNAIMFTNGTSPVFVDISNLIACESVGEVLLIWTNDSPRPSIELNDGVNVPMFKHLLPHLILKGGAASSHSLGHLVGSLKCMQGAFRQSKTMEVMVVGGFVLLGFLAAIAFGGKLPAALIKLLGMVGILVMCLVAHLVRTLTLKRKANKTVNVYQRGIEVCGEQGRQPIAWEQICCADYETEPLGVESSQIMLKAWLKNDGGGETPLTLTWRVDKRDETSSGFLLNRISTLDNTLPDGTKST